jgi:hypothetical protein
MTRLLIAAGLFVALGPSIPTFAESRYAPRTVELLVNGAPQTRFEHDGRVYVEALKGQEYAIRLRNPFPVRVAVALSVDGLNTIDARVTTAADARKWVLNPYQTVTIRGWQTSGTEARRFEFTTEERSYAEALGKAANTGVIAAVFFKERVAPLHDSANDAGSRRSPAGPAPQAAPVPARKAAAAEKSRADEDYAATGMGRRTDHVVSRVWLDLEDRPALSVNIRYEFRPQLVKLGILPAEIRDDRLKRRERAQGFAEEFAPVPPAYR